MTAVLAEVVGPNGHVTAVDIAERDYGAPLTLGQATDLLKASEIGSRIDFHFEFDVLAAEFENDTFDYVVLAHSTWYFANAETLQATLAKVRSWAKRLCLAEWDLAPKSIDQLGHLLAVLFQGQVEAFKETSLANVRTPLSKTKLIEIANKAGWSITSDTLVDSEEMQDGDWEIQAALAGSLQDGVILPPKLQKLIESEIDILNQLAKPRGNKALSAYSLVAERSAGVA